MGEAAKKLDQTKGIGSLRAEMRRLFHGKDQAIDVTLCALVAGGHILLEDVPGVGKTTFIKALAKMLGMSVSRIQFTSDLLPSDIIGVEVFDARDNQFAFHKGPIFANVVMADELNRASPRTQSALLEAMGEGCVTVDRKTHTLPSPFLVFASQNPAESLGTYDLPESQLDRFAAKLNLGYPSEEREREIFSAAAADPLTAIPTKVLSIEDVSEARQRVDKVHLSNSVVDYAKRVVDLSRSDKAFKLGISTRGGVIWLRMARALAVLSERDYVIPDDLQTLATVCLSHRVIGYESVNPASLILGLLEKVEV